MGSYKCLKKKKESKNIVDKLRDRELGIKKKRKKFPKGYVGTSQAPMRPGVALVPTNVHLHRRRRRLEHPQPLDRNSQKYAFVSSALNKVTFLD